MRIMLALSAALAALLGSDAGHAQTFPDRPVTVVVPYGPGGTGDVIARTLAEQLQRQMDATFLVLNKPGAAGTLGAAAVGRSAPDGYTLLLGYTSEMVITPALMDKPGYALDDFVPIAFTGETPLLLIGRLGLPASDMRGLLKVFKAESDKFTYASAGPGSPAHIAGELLNRTAGVALVQVPYKGGAQAVGDILGGHVDVYFSGMPPALPNVQTNKAVALAVTGKSRAPLLPNVPTMEEVGLEGFDLSGWFMLFAPRETPDAVVDLLRRETARALQDNAVRAKLAHAGVEVRPMDTPQMAAFLDHEHRKYERLLKDLNISLK